MATEARETAGLIGSDKVEGTYVYDAKGEHIGSIERVMIDKRSGWPMPCSALAASWALAATTIQSPGTPQVAPVLVGTASTSPRSNSEVHRSTRVRVGTGKIVSVAAGSTSITGRRGETTDRSLVGRLPTGRRPCLSYRGTHNIHTETIANVLHV